VVIGGGQAGLAVSYYLARQERDFVILEGHDRVGESWRKRWDSLRLFTPASFNGLPGMPFPARRGHLPTRDEMANYLEAYAARFSLPVRLGVRVDELARDGAVLVVEAGNSGVEIALDLAARHRVWLAGRDRRQGYVHG
jgi:putative flavoprotein involved in K+ transport